MFHLSGKFRQKRIFFVLLVMNKLVLILICTLAWQVIESQSVKCKYQFEEYAVDVNRPQNTCNWYGCYGKSLCPNAGSSDGACYCKEGYARLFLNGPCISINSILCASKIPPNRKQCAKRENEIYYLDAPTRSCDDSCANIGRYCRPIETFAINYVRPYCACTDGHARLTNGTCVSVYDSSCFELYQPTEEHCSRRGEVFGTRGGCDFIADCANPDPPAPLPPGEVQLCPMYVMDVCLCPAGLLRNSEGACVERRHC